MSDRIPNAYTVSVRASFATVWAQLQERVERPDRFMDGLQGWELQAVKPGVWNRWTEVAGHRLHERITCHPGRRTVTMELQQHPLFEGSTVWEVGAKPHPDGTIDVSCRLDWRYRTGDRPWPDQTDTIQQAVLLVKYACEKAEPGFMPTPERGQAIFESEAYQKFMAGDEDAG